MKVEEFLGCNSSSLVALFLALFQMSGCAWFPWGSRGGHLQNQPAYQEDNGLPFSPPALWHFEARVEPRSDGHGLEVVKTFFYRAISTSEQTRFEERIASFGGESAFLDSVEASLDPLGASDVRTEALVRRTSLGATALWQYRGPISEVLSKRPYFEFFHWHQRDLFWLMGRAPCTSLEPSDADVVEAGRSMGFEMVLRSSSKGAEGHRWPYKRWDDGYLRVEAWSFGEPQSIRYRILYTVLKSHNLCPVSQAAREAALALDVAIREQTGIQW